MARTETLKKKKVENETFSDNTQKLTTTKKQNITPSSKESCSTIREKALEDRVARWKENKEKKTPGFRYTSMEENGKRVNTKSVYQEDIENRTANDLISADLAAATGASSRTYAVQLLDLTRRAMFINDGNDIYKEDLHEDLEFQHNSIHSALIALAPQDEIEGMLVTRLIVLHDQYMQYLAEATRHTKSMIDTPDYFLNRANKLMNVYNSTLEVLMKYRRKGEQKVLVTHHYQQVNVGPGGKAVVTGELQAEGGVMPKDKDAAHGS